MISAAATIGQPAARPLQTCRLHCMGLLVLQRFGRRDDVGAETVVV